MLPQIIAPDGTRSYAPPPDLCQALSTQLIIVIGPPTVDCAGLPSKGMSGPYCNIVDLDLQLSQSHVRFFFAVLRPPSKYTLVSNGI